MYTWKIPVILSEGLHAQGKFMRYENHYTDNIKRGKYEKLLFIIRSLNGVFSSIIKSKGYICTAKIWFLLILYLQ